MMGLLNPSEEYEKQWKKKEDKAYDNIMNEIS
jgi:hypothetical protein